MINPVDSLHDLVIDFERKKTPIESNLKIDKIVAFVSKNMNKLTEESLDEVKQAFRERMTTISGMKDNPTIKSVYLKLKQSTTLIDRVKVRIHKSGISDTESESSESN